MLGYFRALPDQTLSARRRFVVVATTFSFVLIVLIWGSVVFVGRRASAPLPSPATLSPAQSGELPGAAPTLPSPGEVPAPTGGPFEPPLAVPSPTPPVDFSQLSTSLIRAFAPPNTSR